MRHLLFILLSLSSILSFSQKNQFEKDNLLAVMKVNPKMLQGKLSNDPANEEILSDTRREFTSMLRSAVKMPRYLTEIISNPSANGLEYDTYQLSFSKSEDIFTSIFTVNISDYNKLKSGVLQRIQDLEVTTDTKPFSKKKGVITIDDNRVFVYKSKLVVISSNTLPTYKDEKLLVDNEQDAKDYHSFYGNDEEYQEEIKRLKAEGYNLVEKKSEKLPEATPVDTEYVIEDTETGYEDSQYETRYHSIAYINDYKLIDNSTLFKSVFDNVTYSLKSLKAYKSSTSDLTFWVNYESIIDLGKESVLAEIVEEMSSKFGGTMINVPEFTMYDNAQSLMEVSFVDNVSTIDVTSYAGKELYDFAVGMNDKKIDDKVLAYLPATAPAYSGFAIDYMKVMGLYDDFVKQSMSGIPHFDTIAVESYELMKLFIDEEAIAKIIDGQGLIFADGAHNHTRTFTDYYYDEEYNYVSKDTTVTELTPSFFLVLGTQDIVAWQRLVRIIEQTGLLIRDGDMYTFTDKPRLSGKGAKKIDFYMTLKNGVVAFGNDKARLIELSNNSKVNKALRQKFNKFNSITYADFSNIKTYLSTNDFDIPPIFEDVISDYDFMEVSGVKFNSDNFSYSMVLKSNDSSKNILQQFFDTISKIK